MTTTYETGSDSELEEGEDEEEWTVMELVVVCPVCVVVVVPWLEEELEEEPVVVELEIVSGRPRVPEAVPRYT